jgi:hypothetical protein
MRQNSSGALCHLYGTRASTLSRPHLLVQLPPPRVCCRLRLAHVRSRRLTPRVPPPPRPRV